MNPNYLVRTKEKYSTLTKGLKKVAEHLMADQMTFAIHPAKKTGEIIGVSETMILRFCNEIGYKGFRDFQQEVRQHLLELNQTSLENIESNLSANQFAKSMLNDIRHTKVNIDHLQIESMEEAVQIIMNSEKRMVIGHYHSFSFAHWLSINLNYFLNDTTLYRTEDDIGLLDLLPENSCVIIFSFFRYAKDTIRVAKEAKEKGIKIIAITDSRVAPVSEYADVVIPLMLINSMSVLDKAPVTLSLINSLLFEIINRTGNDTIVQTTNRYFINNEEE